MNSRPSNKLRFLWVLPAYVFIGAGMHGFRNGWLAILGLHLVMGVVLLGTRSGRSEIRQLARGWHGLLFAGIALAGALAGVLIYFLWFVARIPELSMVGALSRVGLVDRSWLAFAVYYSLVNPWLEEGFWRGWLGSRSKLPDASDVAYAGYHLVVMALFVTWPWILVSFVILVGAGWMWRQAAAKRDGLLIPALAHFIADASIIAAACLLKGTAG